MIRRAITCLSTRLSTSPTHLLWTARTRGEMSQDLSALPAAAFTANVVEMLDCARCLFVDPYFSTIGCADMCSWGKNRACLLWLLIPHPQFPPNEGDYAYSRRRFDGEAQSHCVMHVIGHLKDGMIRSFAAPSSRS
jgi:hypothetical protein